MSRSCFRRVHFLAVFGTLFHITFLTWTNGSILVYHKRDGHYLGETETDARFGRQAYHPWLSINRTATDKQTYCGHRLVEHMRDICRGRHNSHARMFGHRKRSSDHVSGFEDSVRNENIVAECCKQPCTKTQLRKYCSQYVSNPAQTTQADTRAESLVQTQHEEPSTVPDTAAPPLAKGDDGLSAKPFMLQLQDWYGTPRSAPIRNKYINFVPDYSLITIPRRPIFNSNQRRVDRILLKQQGKPIINLSPPKFQQPSPASDETERDFISQEEALEALRLRPTTGYRHQSPFSPVAIPIGVTDHMPSYYA